LSTPASKVFFVSRMVSSARARETINRRLPCSTDAMVSSSTIANSASCRWV